MPLIEGFRATNVWNAFFLNSVLSSLVIFVAMTIKAHFDTYKDEKGNTISHTTNAKSVIITLAVTFCASFVAYVFMYLMVGYGGGLLVSN